MDELSARLNLEHVDIAAEFHMLCALFACTLDLLFALWRPRVQLPDGRERCALWESHDRVWSALSDLLERLLTTFMFAEVPDVAVWVWVGEVEEKTSAHVHVVPLLHHPRRTIDICKVILTLEAGLHCLYGLPAILDAEVLAHGSCILTPLLSKVGRFIPVVCHLSNLDVSAVVVSICVIFV